MRDNNSNNNLKSKQTEKTWHDKEMYAFPILGTWLLASYFYLFIEILEDNWWALLFNLIISMTIYFFLLKWARSIANGN